MTTPLLRSWQASDLEDLCCRANDDRIARFMTDAFPHPYSSLDGLRFLTLAMSSPERFRAIVMADRAVGAIGLHPQGDILSRNAELGYWLSPEFHGKGIMTRAVGEMVAHGFATLPVHRIFARPFSNSARRTYLWYPQTCLIGRLRCAGRCRCGGLIVVD